MTSIICNTIDEIIASPFAGWRWNHSYHDAAYTLVLADAIPTAENAPACTCPPRYFHAFPCSMTVDVIIRERHAARRPFAVIDWCDEAESTPCPAPSDVCDVVQGCAGTRDCARVEHFSLVEDGHGWCSGADMAADVERQAELRASMARYARAAIAEARRADRHGD